MGKEVKRIEEDFKPRTWLLVILIVIALIICGIFVNKYIQDSKAREAERKEREANSTNIVEDIYDAVGDEMQKQKDTFAIKSFNNKFESKAGTQSEFFVVSLLDDIITSNKTNDEHKITVNYNGTSTLDEETIRSIKGNFTNYQNNREVIFDYDEDGYINTVTIR